MAEAFPMESAEEFRGEYELTLERWLRKRFTLFCVAVVALQALITATIMTSLLSGGGDFVQSFVESAGGPIAALVEFVLPVVALVIAAWFLWWVSPKLTSRSQVLTATGRLVLLLGLLDLAVGTAARWHAPASGGNALFELLFLHLATCLFLPWTPRESVRPMVPLLLVWAVAEVILTGRSDPIGTGLVLCLSPLVVAPGLAISALRIRRLSNRFRSEVFRRGFLRMRREFSQARAMHESLFPEPRHDGRIEFEFVFEPMRELGGDFIHCSRLPGDGIRVVLLDVTGHGLTAAMTVTRLFGEIERIIAEEPTIGPGALMGALNRYTHLTLAPHSIYATGVVAELDPGRGELRHANAGHPAGFLRGPRGNVSSLESPGIMLGVLGPDEFPEDEVTCRLEPDTVLLYFTDGAIEARNARGEQMGRQNLEDLFRRHPAPRNWAKFLALAIRGHTAGAPDDDILITTIRHVGDDANVMHA